MKQVALVFFLAAGLTACKKDSVTNSTGSRTSTKPSARILTEQNNAEFDRSCGGATAWDDHIRIIDNPNWGRFTPDHPENDIFFSGTSVGTLQVWLNDSLYEPYPDGDWFKQSAGLKQWFGKDVTIRMKNGADESAQTVHVPIQVLARRAGDTGPYAKTYASRTGNTFTWEPDPQNTTGRIAIYYRFESGLETDSNSQELDKDVIIVPDNGAYNLDALIPAAAKDMRLSFVRGNSSSLVTGGRKILFDISSYDQHRYTLTD